MTLKEEIFKVKEILKKYPNGHVSVDEPLHYIGRQCRGGIRNKHIYYDGTLYPCVVTGGHKEFAIGDIWNGVDTNKREELLIHTCEKNAECADCSLYGYCRAARCTLENKIAMGEYETPNPVLCNYTHTIYHLCGIDRTRG